MAGVATRNILNMSEDDFISVEELDEQQGLSRPVPPAVIYPTPLVDLADFRDGLKEMGAVIPGIYATQDLYNWYEFAARQNGHTPASHTVLGRYLGKLGFASVTRRVEGRTRKCWHLTRRVLREDPADFSSPMRDDGIQLRRYEVTEDDEQE